MFSIQDFRAEVNRSDVLHGNRFIVQIISGKAQDFGALGPEDEITVVSDTWDNLESRRILSLRAESVTLPGMQFASADGLPPRFGYGPVEGIPYNTIFDPVTVNFALDGKGVVYDYFYQWTNSIVNYRARGQNTKLKASFDGQQPYEVQYKDNFAKNMSIKVYKPYHKPQNEKDYYMEVKLYRVYPRNLPPNQMAWEERNNYLRLPVTFDYTDFEIKVNKK